MAGRKKAKHPNPSLSAKLNAPAPSIQSTTYSIDPTWGYGPDHKNTIAQTLNDQGQLGKKQIDTFLVRVEEAARHYRGLAVHEHTKPLPARVKSEISRLDKAITEFRESFRALSERAGTALDNLGFEIDGRQITLPVRDALRCLVGVASTIGVAADTPAKKGRPSTSARRRFVLKLACIWSDAHEGKWPTRRHDPESVKDYGPFHDFVRVCLMPLDGHHSGADDIIRTVCNMGKKAAKSG